MKSLRSWIAVDPKSHFSIYNIPFGVFSDRNPSIPPQKRCCTAIGDFVLDLAILYDHGLLEMKIKDEKECQSFISTSISNVFTQPYLNSFMASNKLVWQSIRKQIINLLISEDCQNDVFSPDNRLQNNLELQAAAIKPMNAINLHLPVNIGDYTDFYSSREHAENVGSIFRGKNPLTGNCLQPNWLHLPVGYHGRSSSVVVSNTNIRRPCGQILLPGSNEPKFSACKSLDFELELGYFLGGESNELGEMITMENAEDRIFGAVLLNDWSARDIQKWEYVPLGPFTSKNFCTSISPWIVTMDALQPFRCCPSSGSQQTDPSPLPYLADPLYASSALDLTLQVSLQPAEEQEPAVITSTNAKYLYWNPRQQIVHHSVTGCVMRAGDLLGTGTISGPLPGSQGCLLEMTRDGQQALHIFFPTPTAPVKSLCVDMGDVDSVSGLRIVRRNYLEDGDKVIMTGFGQLEDGFRVGFGCVEGVVLPAHCPSQLIV